MFLKVKTNDKFIGVSHNFLTKREAEKMNIQYTKEVGWLKGIHSPSELWE